MASEIRDGSSSKRNCDRFDDFSTAKHAWHEECFDYDESSGEWVNPKFPNLTFEEWLFVPCEEGSDPCNARDGEGSSLRIGWEGEKEYCVVAKYRQDLQVELEDYDYHRVTGPLPLDIAKHWLDHHKRIRTKSEDPKILVRKVSKWRVFDEAKEEGAK